MILNPNGMIPHFLGVLSRSPLGSGQGGMGGMGEMETPEGGPGGPGLPMSTSPGMLPHPFDPRMPPISRMPIQTLPGITGRGGPGGGMLGGGRGRLFDEGGPAERPRERMAGRPGMRSLF